MCSIDDPTQCSVTFDVDDFRTQLLSVPGLVISVLLWVGVADLAPQGGAYPVDRVKRALAKEKQGAPGQKRPPR